MFCLQLHNKKADYSLLVEILVLFERQHNNYQRNSSIALSIFKMFYKKESKSALVQTTGTN